jgi:23S rRNA pseudouridine1911/1915/1917 synthase
MGDARRFTVLADGTERLDRFLADQLQLSRTQAARLVADRRVAVNGVVARASRVLARGDAVLVTLPELEPPREIRPADIPLQVVFEDEHLAVIDKPAGLVVHPAPGHWDDTLVNALVARGTTLSGGAAGRPGIVHRLDRDTSGLLVVAKSDAAHHGLAEALKKRRVRRIYLAAAWGHLSESPLTIDAPIGRDRKDRTRMAVVPEGRAALSRARVRERWSRADLLDVALKTGRTHQIRVHLAHVGHPVVGDALYGAGWERGMGGPTRAWAVELARRTPRQFLHAAELAFDHPVSGERMHFSADLPPDLGAVAAWARGDSTTR